MKKYFLIICIAFIPVSIQAQWSLGGKAGINWSTINYPWSKLGDHADYLSGFQGGIIATYQFNNYFDMQAELFYSARGYTDDEFYLTDESGVRHQQYLHMQNPLSRYSRIGKVLSL